MQEAAEDFGFSPEDGPMPDTLEALSSTDRPRIDTENIAALVRKSRLIPLLDQWARDIEGAMLLHAMNGIEVPGKKLVRGKSNRKWSPDLSIEQEINTRKIGLPLVELWTEPELKSPAQVEKLGADKAMRKAMKALVDDLAFKPPGKLTLVDVSDPREAVDPGEEAITEFADDDSVSGVDE